MDDIEKGLGIVLDALVDMVNQHCQFQGHICPMALSANEHAVEVLVALGYLEKVNSKEWYRWTAKVEAAE